MSDPPEPSKPPEEDDREEVTEEEEEEDEDEEEDEPQLKYERITGDIAKVVRGDLVSSFCVGSKVIVCPFSHIFHSLRKRDRLTWAARQLDPIMARYIYLI